jgi:hypothetical protein
MGPMSFFDNVFWTVPPSDRESGTTDPLGLDAMRDELSNRLVPALTARTHRHEDFFWTLVFLNWGCDQKTDDGRVAKFLAWERCLKLWWCHRKLSGFSGVQRAKIQASHDDAPSLGFSPLLTNQRAQGLLGAHLGPLRALKLVEQAELIPTDDGKDLVEGAGETPSLVAGSWKNWDKAFDRVLIAFGRRIVNALRSRLWSAMPQLKAALEHLNWPSRANWRGAASLMGKELAVYARLAHEFCPWSEELRKRFNAALDLPPLSAEYDVGPTLKKDIPVPLKRWRPLRKVLLSWKTNDIRTLIDLHTAVFEDRGYSKELWLIWEDNKPRITGRGLARMVAEGRDCRWRNAVELMRP